MKRYWMKGVGILFFTAAITLAGCGGGKSPENHALSDSKVSGKSSAEASGASFQTEFGSFNLPSGWVENEEHSTEDKSLFVPEEYDGYGMPDNISVEYGTSHYTKEQSEKFGEAILKQLAEQSQGKIEGQITASGENTKSGEPVLVYKLPLSDRVCTQYYIVGDQNYVMVYETNVSGSASCDSAAEEIVNSFQWK
ncbi:MAG: hypothetical protein MR581_04985 [Lachnospiraceae bacterium]|nr:hypothetical protein [Lachnospiraceae bacterium]